MAADIFTSCPRPLVQTEVRPQASFLHSDGTLFLDFGRAAFGTLLVDFSGKPRPDSLIIHLGEKLASPNRIDRSPPASIRFRSFEQVVSPDVRQFRLIIPRDAPHNQDKAAIQMPAEIGEVFPFRYAEIEHAGGIIPQSACQIRVHYPFNDDASAFSCDNFVLNAVWNLCKYSIKATSFCGIYVDGNRERIPYEGDAYINQLGHYCVDQEYALARYTHEYLIQNPTWPTEWHLHSVLMAWADYLYSGDPASMRAFYPDLCLKTLLDLAREDGLISTRSDLCTREFEQRLRMHGPRYGFKVGLRDLVDWPKSSPGLPDVGERDGYDMCPVNTVVNAFHYRALVLMSRIASHLGLPDDAERFAVRARRVKSAINSVLFDADRGIYLDGEGSSHSSLHANMFPLAFGIVPEEYKLSVTSFVRSRGMACSVYGAQFLLEALYRAGQADAALDLLAATHDRSWWNMIQTGSTITAEAWDVKYKKNLDWNHAWGAAPANIIPRFILGVRPLEPGFRKIIIHPQPGHLTSASGKVPTPLGPVYVDVSRAKDGRLSLRYKTPPGMTVQLHAPESTSITADPGEW